ncbi:S-formylglutathione hydrolase [Sphingobium sufflavum]|uniref:S-formylglutathione hydrolase n=1 Tax=Sphingobium sufflavum TaxID=1129547 RepID=UPI001F1C181E|nr:S-formylglutathione hydrolase [Sphingobium sufflavum]MCE7797804.1 S-formylglutathione hydrolase [Sphingobium sufflavum]
MEQVSSWKSHGGTQGVYTHASTATGTPMTFSIFVPDHAPGAKLPVLWYLSGLTCTHANVTEKGEYRAACAEHGIIFIAPDTSPRGDDVPDDDGWDFGKGAGFYLDATQEPWSQHYRMRTYIEEELPALIADHFPVDADRQSIMGHSMGGHGALTIALCNPGRFRSVSALAPISSASQSALARKALTGYLGPDEDAWRAYDACALIADGAGLPNLLVDQGDADEFLADLQPGLLAIAAKKADFPAAIRMQPGYGHSYYFISTFMADHVGWHAARLSSDE